MKQLVHVKVNGEWHDVVVDTRQTVLEMLRDVLFLTGPKEGCANGNCGACAVLLNGEAVDSCLMLAVEAEGQEVTTAEGIASNGSLSAVQQAFVDTGSMECGFCMPGFVVSATSLLQEKPHATEEEIRTGLAGNLCRCTGYDKIVRAVLQVAQAQ